MADDNDERIKALEMQLKRAQDEAVESRKKAREYEEADTKRAADAKARDDEETKKRGDFEKLLNDTKAESESQKRSFAQREAAFKRRIVDEALRARLADAIDPDVVALAVDRKSIAVGDEYELSGLDEAITGLRTAKPHLFKVADGGGKGDGQRASGGNVPPDRSGGGNKGADFSKMSDQEFREVLQGSYGL